MRNRIFATGRSCVSGAPKDCIALAAIGILGAWLAGCSQGGNTDRYDPKLGVSSSQRVVETGPIRKGGGHYKLGSPYSVAGRWYVPREEPNYDRSGVASWYGDDFHGRRTANGEIFDRHALTAAHPTLPLPSYAYVTNLSNGRTVLVRINDRGPYARDRILDLSQASATALGFAGHGITNVRVRYAGRAPLDGNDAHERRWLASQPWNGALAGYAMNTPPRAVRPAPAASRPASSDTANGTWSVDSYRASLRSGRQSLGAVE